MNAEKALLSYRNFLSGKAFKPKDAIAIFIAHFGKKLTAVGYPHFELQFYAYTLGVTEVPEYWKNVVTFGVTLAAGILTFAVTWLMTYFVVKYFNPVTVLPEHITMLQDAGYQIIPPSEIQTAKPEDAVNVKKKGPTFQETFLNGGPYDSLKAVANNMYAVSLDGVVYSGMVMFIGSTVAAMNYHVYKDMKNMRSMMAPFVNKSHVPSARTVEPGDFELLRVFQDRDLCFVNFPAARPHRKISSRFVSRDLKFVPASTVMVAFDRVERAVMFDAVGNYKSINKPFDFNSSDPNNPIRVSKSYSYTWPRAMRGQCGTPLAASIANEYKIIGIHGAACGDCAYATAIYSEDFDGLMFDSNTKPEDMTTIVQGGGMAFTYSCPVGSYNIDDDLNITCPVTTVATGETVFRRTAFSRHKFRGTEGPKSPANLGKEAYERALVKEDVTLPG